MVTIINGRKIAKQLNQETAWQVGKLASYGIKPKLIMIVVGNHPASLLYVRMKKRLARRLKIHAVIKHLSDQIDQSQLIRLIMQYNQDFMVDAILVQSPLPKWIDESLVDDQIKSTKDVDGFGSVNLGRLFLNRKGFYPVACTSRGIMTLLDKYQVPLKGRQVVIIGANRIVDQPLLGLMVNEGATVSILPSNVKNIFAYTRSADVVVSDAGRVNLINGLELKPGCTVIDVSNNHDANGKLVGDVNFKSAEKIAGKITPVPGGVGPMIIATLMRQTVELCKIHHYR